jgi:hypothetical protein
MLSILLSLYSLKSLYTLFVFVFPKEVIGLDVTVYEEFS